MLNNTPFEAAYLFSIKVYKIYPQINLDCLTLKSTKLPLLGHSDVSHMEGLIHLTGGV